MLFGDEMKIHTRNAREVKIALLWWGTGEERCSCFCCCCLLNTNLGKVLNDHFVHAAASYIDCAAFEHCSIYMLIVVIRRNEWIEYEANMFEISELEDDGSSLRSFFFYFTGEFTIDVHHWWIMQSTTCSYMNLMGLNWSTHFMWVLACFHIPNRHLICKNEQLFGHFFPSYHWL